MTVLIILLSFCCNYVWTVKDVDESKKITFTCFSIVLLVVVFLLSIVFGGGAPVDEV